MKSKQLYALTWREIWIVLISAFLACQTVNSQTPTIVAIPTLGGSSSTPYGVNALGYVVGSSQLTGNSAEHAFLFTGGTTLDLGTLSGGSSVAYAVNRTGSVAGSSDIPGTASTMAFLYSEGVMLNLGTLGGSSSDAIAINDAGQVIGNWFNTANNDYQGFIYSAGQMVDLGTLGGTYSLVYGLNSSGWVTGESSLAGETETHAYLWKTGAMIDLGSLGGSYSTPWDINDSGWITGYSYTVGDAQIRAFLYDGTNLIDLGSLGGGISYGYAIDNSGRVAGDSSTGLGRNHGFFYSGGRMIDLGTLGGSYSSVYDMNNSGQVVGDSTDINNLSHPFLWENGTMTNLNALIPADSGWELMTAYNISDGGHILGYGLLQGNGAWFLLSLNRVQNNTPPVAEAGPDQVVECTGAQTTVVLNGTGSSDPDGDAITYEWYYGSTLLSTQATVSMSFAVGTYQMTLKVTDSKRAFSQDSTAVIVQDTTPPAIQSVAANPAILSPQTKEIVPVTVTVTALDNCDPAPVSQIISISSSEPVTGPGDRTSPDWEITGPLTANLRAEIGTGTSRIYTILVQCSDSYGNTSAGSVTVNVSKQKPGKPR